MRTLRATAVAAVCGLTAAATGQSPLTQPGFVAGGPAAVQDVSPAGGGGAQNFVNAYGEPFVVPAQYCAPAGGGGYCGPGGGYGGYPGGGDGGGGAYGAGWMNTEQCGPHYFDFSAEYLHYERDDTPFSDLPISTFGFANENLAGLEAQTALSAGGLDSDSLDGYRLTGRLDVGALSVFEISYSGMYDSSDALSASVTDPQSTARLFSVFSRYGTRTNGDSAASTPGRPINDIVAPNNNPGGNNFAETDFATSHSIEFESELHTAEALFRRYWVGYNPRVSGTLLLGFRYTNLRERLAFHSIGSQQLTSNPDTFGADPTLAITIASEADNHLAGFEFGGDGWITLVQGLRAGGEIKAGIYDNDYEVSNSVTAVDGSPSSVTPALKGNQVAFLTEAKLMAVADITPNLSLKGGYEVLFISDVALMGDGIASAQPYGDINGISDSIGGSNAPTADGEVLYHGFSAGLEYVW